MRNTRNQPTYDTTNHPRHLLGIASVFLRSSLLFLLCFFTMCSILEAQESEFNEPIDIVYLWVDGNDPEWREIKNYYRDLADGKKDISQDGATDNRYYDNEELKYSLRSILMYAPFVNHIYIVTMNQVPSWFVPHPKVTIVDHTEIFVNQGDLPTFNSQAIESNLHRVPNLSEHFIYFNDDVLLGAPVSPSDFFTADGKVKVLFEASLSPSGPPTGPETTYRGAWRNTNALLDAAYRVEPRYRLCHAPFALKKSFIEASEREFPQVFASNATHKFRSVYDYNMTNGLLQYHWLYHDLVEEGDMTNKMVTLRTDAVFKRTQRHLESVRKEKIQTYCIQDNMTENSDTTRKVLHNFLESMYPQPAPWESK